MPLRIGLIGAGSMGSLHARVLSGGDSTELAWIADPDRVTGERLAGRFGTKWLPEPELVGIDAAVIAAPTQFHHAYAMAIVDAGVPLLVEKPIAETLADVVEIIEASSRQGTVLMCGLLERFNPAVRTAAEIAREPLHVATVRHSPYAERIRTGVASDLLIHDIDVVVRLMGEAPAALSGHYGYFEPRSTHGSEDVAEATLRFSQGQIASLSVSRIAQHKIRSLTIGELGRLIEVDLLRQTITIYRHVQESGFDEDAGYTQQTIIEIPVVRYPGEPLQLQLSHFVDLIEGRADPEAERETLLLPHSLIDQIASSARQSGRR
ncbi:MAG: Gfo/Idh/MocA family oxidoreductase [Ilumatobacteraceae bacterium]